VPSAARAAPLGPADWPRGTGGGIDDSLRRGGGAPAGTIGASGAEASLAGREVGEAGEVDEAGEAGAVDGAAAAPGLTDPPEVDPVSTVLSPLRSPKARTPGAGVIAAAVVSRLTAAGSLRPHAAQLAASSPFSPPQNGQKRISLHERTRLSRPRWS
jgi:hypothetical protein